MNSFTKLYASLPAGYITRSTISILFGGGAVFIGYQLHSGNEHFHREMVMPLIHRLFDGENAHQLGVKLAKYGLFIGSENRKEYRELRCSLFGREVDNPIGLAAGFDKNGEAIVGLRRSGFGFIEIGSVTPRPQTGNERPRVFRLIEDQAVINCYGFNSDGVGAVVGRVKKVFDPSSRVALGINLGKNKTTVEAVHDYEIGVTYFAAHCDYLVVNISSPNTPGLRALQSKKELTCLLAILRAALQRSVDTSNATPKLLIKISPDLSKSEMKDIAEIAIMAAGIGSEIYVKGREKRSLQITVIQTTIRSLGESHNIYAPAIASTLSMVLLYATQQSNAPIRLKAITQTERAALDKLLMRREGIKVFTGAPLRDLSTSCIAEMYRLTRGQLPIIGCGGVSSGADAYEKIRAGACAVQLYTAIVYAGFPVVGRVKRELVELLRRDGYSNVIEAIGAKHREK